MASNVRPSEREEFLSHIGRESESDILREMLLIFNDFDKLRDTALAFKQSKASK